MEKIRIIGDQNMLLFVSDRGLKEQALKGRDARGGRIRRNGNPLSGEAILGWEKKRKNSPTAKEKDAHQNQTSL